jgi:hypothetical protein
LQGYKQNDGYGQQKGNAERHVQEEKKEEYGHKEKKGGYVHSEERNYPERKVKIGKKLSEPNSTESIYRNINRMRDMANKRDMAIMANKKGMPKDMVKKREIPMDIAMKRKKKNMAMKKRKGIIPKRR